MKPRSRRYAKPSATISTTIYAPRYRSPRGKVFLSIRSCRFSWDGADHKALQNARLGTFHPCRLLYHHHCANPKLFRNYLLEQLTLLYQDYGAHISVELSQHEIPYPYVIDGVHHWTLDRSMSAGLTRYITLPPSCHKLAMRPRMACSIPPSSHPLSHFGRPRVDFRWRVCVTTPARRRTLPALRAVHQLLPATWMSSSAGAAARSSIPLAPITLSCAGGIYGSPPRPKRRNRPFPIWRGRSAQMPAWHLITPRRQRDHPD